MSVTLTINNTIKSISIPIVFLQMPFIFL